MQNKVISASAGSGKTYRLATEYISILLKNLGDKDFHFERILVITFTKKAAGEIRNKIFSMLDLILYSPLDNLQRRDLIENLEARTGVKINNITLDKLKEIVIKIITHKDKVRISTIDSLINQVFKSMIAPIMNITNYTIDENANFDIWEEIFEELVKQDNISFLKEMLELNSEKNVENLGKVFTELIEDRWVLHLMKENFNLPCSDRTEVSSATTDRTEASSAATDRTEASSAATDRTEASSATTDTQISEREVTLNDFKLLFIDYCTGLREIILQKMEGGQKFDDFLLKDAVLLLMKSWDHSSPNSNGYLNSITEANFLEGINNFLEKGIFKLNRTLINSLIKDTIKLYNGQKIKNYTSAEIDKLKSAFALVIYYYYYLPELKQITNIWEIILKKYDKIKQKSRILSYSDISWHTYQYLYNPNYSMIDKENFIVENQFYEFLAVRNQYFLIDEFQDTSFMQFMILAPMMKDLIAGNSVHSDTGVIVVGDEKQSIYGWRCGEKGLLNYMQTFLNTKIESLTHCYRSGPIIVDFINYLFKDEKYNFGSLDDDLETWNYAGDIISGKPNETSSVMNYFEKYEAELDSHKSFVENFVKPSLNKGLSGEIAILARKNEDLEKISLALAENNIPFVLESSRSIFDHHIPLSIYHLMRYIQYNDFMALFNFLRSEVMNLEGAEIKEILKRLQCQSESDATGILLIDELYKKYHSPNEIDILYKNPLTLCHDIVNRFHYTTIFNREAEIKNLHNFINIIADFMKNPIDYSPNLNGFLQFYENMQEKKQLKQQSTQAKGVINLITIHKSKGLGFDTVFVYFDTRPARKGNQKLKLKFIVDKNNYSHLNSVMITMNYEAALKELFKKEYNILENKKIIEEMNVVYVAFTRAKTNLAVYWLYDEKKKVDIEPSFKNKMLKLAMEWNENSPPINVGEDPPTSLMGDNREIERETLSYFDPENKNLVLIEKQLEFEYINLKNMFLKNKNKLIGNITHYYLSFIKYDLPKEHVLANLQTFKSYGNILPKSEIDDLIIIIKNFINNNKHYFSREWDKIFTEFTIFSPDKKQYIIDRLMINTPLKKILILDYKTGEILDQNQVNYYLELIQKLPIFPKEKYEISGEYVRVHSWDV